MRCDKNSYPSVTFRFNLSCSFLIKLRFSLVKSDNFLHLSLFFSFWLLLLTVINNPHSVCCCHVGRPHSCRQGVKQLFSLQLSLVLSNAYKFPGERVRELIKSIISRASSHKSRIMGTDDKKVLLLGAGMVSGPFADFYSKQPKTHLTVATESRQDGQKLIINDNIHSVVLDVHREHERLAKLVQYVPFLLFF